MSSKRVGRRAAAYAAFAKSKLEKLAAAAALGLAACGLAGPAHAGNVFTGQFGTGNTWNIYEQINTPFSFLQALEFAATRTDPTGGSVVGNLVAINSAAEQTHIRANTTGTRWIGLTDRVGVAEGASESLFQTDPMTQGWAWVTGEPFTYQNWVPRNDMGQIVEPNDSTGEDAAHLNGDATGFWNDNKSGFGADLPVPDLDSTDESAAATMGFVIEWRLNAATEPTGFPTDRPDPALPRFFPSPLARLPGPNGTASAFGVLDITGLGSSGDVRAAIGKVLSGEGTQVTGTAARFDIHDPDAGGAQYSVPGPQVPTPSNVAGVDDDNFQSVVKGTFQVPAGAGGEYTFFARSDDGFAMRILSQATPGDPVVQHKFTAANVGVVDEDGTLAFAAPTGDSNTRGVINLQPGTYDVEFLVFENGGGAAWEVTTAKGNFVSNLNAAPQWILLGDNSSIPAAPTIKQPARMTGEAAVKNFAFNGDIGSVVSSFRANPEFTAESSVNSVILKGNSGSGTLGGTLAADLQHVFPNGNDQDNFSTAITGQLEVLDTDGAAGELLTFAIFADDNAALHIVGQNFTAAAGDGTTMVGTPGGESDSWLLADFRTGNTNAFGLITVPEGTYDFEAFHLEEGGGAAMEVWVAAGDRLTTRLGSGAFFPLALTAFPDKERPANAGLPLVAGPGTGPIGGGGLDGDFNDDGQVDGSDFIVWQQGGSPNPMSASDLDLWKANFGATGGGAGAVPEPGSLGLALAAALAVGAVRRRS